VAFPANRRRALWLAAMVHRVSVIGLACFLPLHFLTLGTAIQGEARLETVLRWSDQPLVKAAETALMFLLFVHMLGGLRLLAIENLPWFGWQKPLAAAAVAASAVLAFIFLAQALR